jgi:hypothetical protein
LLESYFLCKNDCEKRHLQVKPQQVFPAWHGSTKSVAGELLFVQKWLRKTTPPGDLAF